MEPCSLIWWCSSSIYTYLTKLKQSELSTKSIWPQNSIYFSWAVLLILFLSSSVYLNFFSQVLTAYLHSWLRHVVFNKPLHNWNNVAFSNSNVSHCNVFFFSFTIKLWNSFTFSFLLTLLFSYFLYLFCSFYYLFLYFLFFCKASPLWRLLSIYLIFLMMTLYTGQKYFRCFWNLGIPQVKGIQFPSWNKRTSY